MISGLAVSGMVLSVMSLLLMIWVIWINMVKMKSFREKKSPFECGFDVWGKSRFPFSFRFFFMVIMFVVFDAELCVLFRVPAESAAGYFKILMELGLIIFLMWMGVMEEWRRGAFNWEYK